MNGENMTIRTTRDGHLDIDLVCGPIHKARSDRQRVSKLAADSSQCPFPDKHVERIQEGYANVHSC